MGENGEFKNPKDDIVAVSSWPPGHNAVSVIISRTFPAARSLLFIGKSNSVQPPTSLEPLILHMTLGWVTQKRLRIRCIAWNEKKMLDLWASMVGTLDTSAVARGLAIV